MGLMVRSLFLNFSFCLFLLGPLGPARALAASGILTAEQALRQSLAQFQRGAFLPALETMGRVEPSAAGDIRLVYWTGVYLHRLQAYEAAAAKLTLVLQSPARGRFENAPYLLGQAAFSLQAFRKARDAFHASAEQGYKRGASLYYVAFTSKALDDDERALSTYRQILELPATDWDMKQPAAFQIAEIRYERALKIASVSDRRQAYVKQVIPAFEWARDLDHGNPLSQQAEARIAEIRGKLGDGVRYTANGTPVPVKSWVLRASQDFKYDTNVINEPDDRIVKVSNTASALSHTGLFAKNEFLFRNWLALTPELAADATMHFNRGDSSVYSNDNMSVAPALRCRMDYRWNGKPVAALVEYEFNAATRDYLGEMQQLYYSKSSNIILGQRWNFFSVGPTTLKANLKLSENVNPSLSYIGPGFLLSQGWLTLKRYILSTSLGFENQWTNDRFYAQRNYRFSVGYALPGLPWNTSVDLAFNFALTDTVNQQETRGWEKNYNPTLGLTKYLDQQGRFAVGVNYAFTRNSSKDTTSYAYSKHVYGLNGQATF